MRALWLLVLLAGCADQPDFDSRYDNAESEIRERAREIDYELESREKQANRPAASLDKPKD